MTELTDRQLDVAREVARFAMNKQIASELGISERQVEKHIADIAIRWQLDRTRNLRVQIALGYVLRYQNAA